LFEVVIDDQDDRIDVALKPILKMLVETFAWRMLVSLSLTGR